MGTVKYSGPVASFHCPTEATIRSLKVHFSPKQEGSGDPSPENVRPIVGWEGVEVKQTQNNLFNENSITYSRWTDSGGYVNISATYGCISEKIKLNSTSFTLIAMAERPNSMSIIEYDANGNFLRRTHGNQVQYVKVNNTLSSTAYIAVQISHSNGGTTITPEYVNQRNMMLVEGTDDPIVYEPYHGSTTNYEFGVLGKNKFNPQIAINDGYATSASNYTITNDLIRYDVPLDYNSLAWCGSQYLDLIPNQTYTATIIYVSEYQQKSNAYTSDILRIYCKKPDDSTVLIAAKTVSNRIDDTCSVTFTVPDYSTGIKINKILGYPITAGDYYEWKVQLELGSTATTYEPYDPKHTVYGGWVDLISGEVCEEWIKHDMSQISIASPSSTSTPWDHMFTIRGVWKETGYDKKHGVNNVMCEVARRRVGSEPYANGIMNALSNSSAIYFYDDTVETVEEFKEKYAGKYIAYETNFPASYSLAPTQLQTFLGQNNVWSNADYVEVEYDLHETQTIRARKQFIVANQPHIVKPAAAPLQNFVTDMKAPLKSCRVYFSPVQEGSGDPSPENVRTISGWTRIEVYRGYEYLSNVQITTGKTLNSSGVEATESGMAVTDYIPVEVGHTYVFKFTSTTAGRTRRIFGYSASKEPTNQLVSVSWATVGNTFSMNAEIPSGTSYIRACYYNNDIDKTLTEPSTVTTLPIDWTTEAGTVYGGYVDLVKGELIQTYYKLIADGINLKVNSYYTNIADLIGGGIVYLNPIGAAAKSGGTTGHPPNVFCDSIPLFTQNYVGSLSQEPPFATAVQGGRQYIIIYPGKLSEHPEVTDATTAKAFVNNWLQSNPVTIVYELVEPIVYQLTPQQLSTLRGTNNIWSNSNGDITVQFWKH